jgi:hypothetical protein
MFQPGGVTRRLWLICTPRVSQSVGSRRPMSSPISRAIWRSTGQAADGEHGAQGQSRRRISGHDQQTLPDEEVQSGDLSGAGGIAAGGRWCHRAGGIHRGEHAAGRRFAGCASRGSRCRLPLLELQPGLQDQHLQIRGRMVAHPGIRLRGSFARAVRAPNVVELYAPGVGGLDGSYAADPCAGANRVQPRPVRENGCARPGSVREYFAAIRPVNTTGCWAAIRICSRRRRSRPPSASAGHRRICPNLRAQVDYYDIHIENVIQGTGGRSS